jgi:hypothetical protein
MFEGYSFVVFPVQREDGTKQKGLKRNHWTKMPGGVRKVAQTTIVSKQIQ